MGTKLLTEKYADDIHGVLHCYDRVLISGNLHPLCYAKGMTKYLYIHQIRIFDYTEKFAEPLRDLIRQNAQLVAQENELEIEFITRQADFRKEARIKAIIAQRGTHPGLVHIFSAMEGCAAYRPWHDKASHKTYVKGTQGKCLHYYFYFIDPELGLCYLRVPTWCPFRLQFYCNGHNALAAQLEKEQMTYQQIDNAFVRIADFERANQLAAELGMPALHAQLDQYAALYCPAVTQARIELSMEHHAGRIRYRHCLQRATDTSSDLSPSR